MKIAEEKSLKDKTNKTFVDIFSVEEGLYFDFFFHKYAHNVFKFLDSEFYDINVVKALIYMLPGSRGKKGGNGPHRLELIIQFTDYVDLYIIPHIRELAANMKKLYPYMIIANLEGKPFRFYVVAFDGVYSFQTFTSAFDILFKAFFAFNVDYAGDVKSVYTFIQKTFFDIHLDKDSKGSAISKLINSIDHTRL